MSSRDRYKFLPSQKSFEPPKKEMAWWAKVLGVIIAFPCLAVGLFLFIYIPLYAADKLTGGQGGGLGLLIFAVVIAAEITGIYFICKKLDSK
jgi:hypothetical protein